MANDAPSLQEALDALDEIVYVCTPDGQLLDWNARLQAVTGQSSAALADMTLPDLVPEEYQSQVSDALAHALDTNSTVHRDLPLTTADDHPVYTFSFSPTDNGTQVAGVARLQEPAQDTVTSSQDSTFTMPVVEIWDGIVLSPIVGKLGSRQAEQFTETLLEEIVNHEATIALIDITGVRSVDTQTAQHLIDTIQAVDLLGAEVIITGINPDLARTLVKLGIGFDAKTRSSLIDGLQTAFRMRGVSIN